MNKRTFAGTNAGYATPDRAAILLQSVPYDGTSTWGKGADEGFDAFLEASEHMETFDIETGLEVYRKGIHILPPVDENSTPEKVFEAVYTRTAELLKTGKFLTFFGGEHAVSIGIIKAFYEFYPGLTVLQLDAHTDLRPEYMGSPYNHACALFDASRNTNLIQVGIRSMDPAEEPDFDRSKCYFAEEMEGQTAWMDESIQKMGEKVYITLDLDVLDPSLMPATGTPEPGGMTWYPLITYLKKVFQSREVVGFDLVELAPVRNMRHPEFLAAKLYYKMLSYKFMNHDG